MDQRNCNCNHSNLNRYQYRGIWVEVFVEADFERDHVLYFASVELPGEGGVISGHLQESREKAEFSAEELIDSWN